MEKNILKQYDSVLKEIGETGRRIRETQAKIDRMEKDGTVIRYASGQGTQASYQYVEQGQGCEGHLHLKCVKCGKILHLDCEFMKKMEL